MDDYYIGLRSEHDAQSVLSSLREILATYELNLNDQKTKIQSSLEPINDLWAQRLRDHMQFPTAFGPFPGLPLLHGKLERAFAEAVNSAKEVGSDSPIKILFRALDEAKIYSSSEWEFAEQNIQRIIQKHPHTIDYACLLVAKRKALDLEIDTEGWTSVAEMIVKRGLALNHHHEVIWLVWLLLACDIDLPFDMIAELTKSRNAHIRALLVQAFVDGKIGRKPKLSLGAPLSSVDGNWLVNLVARSQDFSKASFSGLLADEFEHLANRKIKLIDFNEYLLSAQEDGKRAISRTRYGYDDEEDDFDHDHDMDHDEFFGQFEDDGPM